MLLLRSSAPGALEELPYSFADLPLRDFERKPEASQAAAFLLRRPGQQAGECLAFAGMDALVGTAPCKITDGQLWSYRSQQLVLAHDTSLCLDEFGPHAGDDLGVYWCHGGVNQRFMRREGKPPMFCSQAPQAHCAERVAPRDVVGSSAARASPPPLFTDAAALPPTPPTPLKPSRPPCAPDSVAAVAHCAVWAARGECVFNARYMRRHCARSCARFAAGAECDPDVENGADAPPAMPMKQEDGGWGTALGLDNRAGGSVDELKSEL